MLLTRPHVPLATIGWTTHCFVMRSQVRPAGPEQSGPVLRCGSQAAPDVVTLAWQTPIADIVAPTHWRPAPQGRDREQAPAAATGRWQVIVAGTQVSVGPQPELAHDVPT